MKFTHQLQLPAWLIACLFLIIPGCKSTDTPLTLRDPAPAQPAGVKESEARDFWENWATDNIQTGDIVFRMGTTRHYGFVDSSRLAALVADSKFSHVGMAAVENGETVVYDISISGARRRPFVDFVFEYQLAFGVKRPTPDHEQRIDGAIEFCRSVYQQQPEFDESMRLDNDSLYCTEMVETAYRSSGLELSQPIALQDYPRYKDFSTWMKIADAVTSLDPDQRVYSPGNETEGLWASNHLQTVVEVSDPYAMIRLAEAIVPGGTSRKSVIHVNHSTATDGDGRLD